MLCAITGHPAEEPVISKFGHVYEKRIITKQLEMNGKCPITGEPLSQDDLIPVKVPKIAKPRVASATSIPSLVQLFQNEWDSLMLETFSLKSQLDSVRQDLAQALYQHDAACRVIARLTKERDEARSALANVTKGGVAPQTNGAAQTDSMEVEATEPNTLSASITQRMTEHAQSMMPLRRKRQISESLAKQDEIAKYSVTSSITGLHATNPPGITCVDIHPKQSDLVISGGVDKVAVVLNSSSGKEVHRLSGAHSKKITDVAFHPTEPLFFTASQDKTVVTWSPDGNKYKVGHTFSAHKDEVTGLSLHPLGDFIGTTSLDKSFAFHDIRRGQTLMQLTSHQTESGLTTCNFHPDGLLLTTGTKNGHVLIWNVQERKVAVDLAVAKDASPHKGETTSTSFSENGYYLASGGTDGVLKLWDLKKQTLFNSVTIADNYSISSVAFDYSGQYLAVVGNDVRVYTTKGLNHVVTLGEHNAQVTDIAWGVDATSLISSSMDRSLKFYGKR